MFILHFCTGQWRCCRCGQTDNRKATKEEMELFNQRTKELKTLASAPRPELSPPCGVADCLVIGSVLGLIPSAKTGSDTQPTQERIPDTGGTRKCPACAEIIKTDANVCRFCGRNFSTAEVTQAQQEQARAAEVAVQQAVFAKQQERHTRRLHARRIWRLVFGIPLTCIGGFFVIAGTCMFFDSSAWQPGATTGDRVLGCLPPVVVVGLLPLAGGIALLRTAKSIKRLLLAARDAPPVASNQPTDPSKTEAVG